MHHLFSAASSVVVNVFQCLVEFDRENSAEFLLPTILSILVDRGHLQRVCREWSRLLSNTQSLSLASLHFNAFGCRGAATQIFARCTTLRDFRLAACSLEASLCKRTIVEFLKLPWRFRVARLDKYLQRSDTFSREMFGQDLARAQNFLSPQTIALVERAVTQFSEGISIPTRWPPASQRHLQAIYLQYELLDFRWGRQREVAPDEFVAWFKNVQVYSWRNLHREHGTSWAVKVLAQLSSGLCLPSQINHEVKGTCMFNFRNQSFGAMMRVCLGSRLDLILDFVTIPIHDCART